MTLVVAADLIATPLLMGDLLVTSSPQGRPLPAIPTLGPRSFKGVFGGRTVTGLRQKLVLVNDYIAVGWAGAPFQASSLTKELIQHVGSRNAPMADVKALLEHQIQSENLDLSVVGITVSETGFSVFGIGCERSSIGSSGLCYVAGSGSTHFQSLSQSIDVHGFNNLTNHEAALSTMIALSSRLILDEMFTSDTLSNAYGAGFEYVISYKDELGNWKLKKFGDFASLFWRLDLDTNGKVAESKAVRVGIPAVLH